MIPGLRGLPGLGVAPGILPLIPSDRSAVVLGGLSRLILPKIEGLEEIALIVHVTIEELVLERILLLDCLLGATRTRVLISA